MDPLTLAIVKAIATTCVKLYLTSLLGGGTGVTYDKSELGYKVPGWYMNPGRSKATFYAYGTSVHGDEFESIEDARQRALEQMANHIRLSNRKIISEEVHYDKASVKQKRLVELFIRAEGLEDFIRMNAALDKKQLVKVEFPKTDFRAFVRLALPSEDYVAYQQDILKELKTKIVRQKTEEILEEMEKEKAAVTPLSEVPEAMPARPPDTAPTPPPPPAEEPIPGAEAAFDELEAESEK